MFIKNIFLLLTLIQIQKKRFFELFRLNIAKLRLFYTESQTAPIVLKHIKISGTLIAAVPVKVKASFQYERATEYSLFLLLIFLLCVALA